LHAAFSYKLTTKCSLVVVDKKKSAKRLKALFEPGYEQAARINKDFARCNLVVSSQLNAA
jgi:hypothetical protein